MILQCSSGKKISIDSNDSHLGWKGVSHIILKVGQSNIISAHVYEQKIFLSNYA
jgi:hypothetical protein